MKPQTEQIVANLEDLTDDLYYSLVGDEPYVITTWEVEEKGEFSWENFLVDNKALTPFESSDFLNKISQSQSQTVSEHYQNLIELLQANLSNLAIYGYGFPELPEDLFGGDLPIYDYDRQLPEIPVIIGSLAEGEWIGLVPKQCNGTDSSSQFIIPDMTSIAASSAALVEQIRSITSQIEHQSQYWKLQKLWEVVVTSSRNLLMEKLLDDAAFMDIYELERFLRFDMKDEEELEDEDTHKEFQIRDFFQSPLLNSRVYNLDFNCGGEHFTLHYVLGQTEDGDWMGLITDSYTF
ncbi:MAG: hypothetical protein F6K36_25355 [Symploca sp. SIO3C6]|uniref:Uncharacterized protein n=1 Tax=Symploca sp. SIO1C4 TaxID=2607765 RepID=A0A6B3N9N2_9CYAN|nr:hypothetical protein [Symploca sp. SIO3C6]NER28203.1 hypothetical protein [Symploca sp. SIO1C4]